MFIQPKCLFHWGQFSVPSRTRSLKIINLPMVSAWSSGYGTGMGFRVGCCCRWFGHSALVIGRPAQWWDEMLWGPCLTFIFASTATSLMPKRGIGRKETGQQLWVGLLFFFFNLDYWELSLWGWVMSLVSIHVGMTNILIFWPHSEMPLHLPLLLTSKFPTFSFQFLQHCPKLQQWLTHRALFPTPCKVDFEMCCFKFHPKHGFSFSTVLVSNF